MHGDVRKLSSIYRQLYSAAIGCLDRRGRLLGTWPPIARLGRRPDWRGSPLPLGAPLCRVVLMLRNERRSAPSPGSYACRR